MIEGERERQGDYIFTAHLVGEYSFCFSNDMSSFSEKLVDFDIMVESEPRPVAPAKPTALTEQTSSLEESIYKLSGSISSIQRTQKYFRTRENRNVRPSSTDPIAAGADPHLAAPRTGQHRPKHAVADLHVQHQRKHPHVRHERIPSLGSVVSPSLRPTDPPLTPTSTCSCPALLLGPESETASLGRAAGLSPMDCVGKGWCNAGAAHTWSSVHFVGRRRTGRRTRFGSLARIGKGDSLFVWVFKSEVALPGMGLGRQGHNGVVTPPRAARRQLLASTVYLHRSAPRPRIF